MMDYHMHSNYSTDSDMPMEAACATAIKLNLREICFTDHVDIDWPIPGQEFYITRMDDYINELEMLAKKYEPGIKIKKGLEVGLQPHVLEEASSLVSSLPLDFVIGSVHLVDRKDPASEDYFLGKTKEEAYVGYYSEILRLVRAYDNFDVVGHIDYVRRYWPGEHSPDDYMIGFDVVEEILKVIIDKGKGIEVNTSGYKRPFLDSSNPHFCVVKRYFELGGEIVTVGSDAHSTRFIGYQFQRALGEIKKAGFSYLASFTARKPSFIKID